MLYNVERVIIMKKLNYLIFILQVLLCITIIFIPTTVKADFLSDVINQADDFVNTGENSKTITMDETGMKSVSDDIYNILLTIGIVTAVIIGAFLGVQFIIASAEEKAKVKEALVPYLIGCIVVFGAFSIWKVVLVALK